MEVRVLSTSRSLTCTTSASPPPWRLFICHISPTPGRTPFAHAIGVFQFPPGHAQHRVPRRSSSWMAGCLLLDRLGTCGVASKTTGIACRRPSQVSMCGPSWPPRWWMATLAGRNTRYDEAGIFRRLSSDKIPDSVDANTRTGSSQGANTVPAALARRRRRILPDTGRCSRCFARPKTCRPTTFRPNPPRS